MTSPITGNGVSTQPRLTVWLGLPTLCTWPLEGWTPTSSSSLWRRLTSTASSGMPMTRVKSRTLPGSITRVWFLLVRMPTSRSGTSAGQTKRCTIKLPECTVESPSLNIPRFSEILDVQKEQNEASEEAKKLRGFQQADNYMADSIYFGTNFILTLMLVCITAL